MALNGYGVWSLVARVLVGSLFALVLLWTATTWRPRLEFHRAAVAQLLGFGSSMLGANMLKYFSGNVDNLLVGRFLGTTSLGFYSRAHNVMLLPLTQVTTVLQTVMFPALSRLQRQPGRAKSIYLRALSVIALVVFPLMFGLFVLADTFVMVLFTEKWAGMIPTLRVLCLVGLLQSLTSTTRWLYTSQGRADWMLRWGLVSTAMTTLSFVPGILLDSLEIVAVGYAIVSVLMLYLEFSIPGRLIGLTFVEVAKELSGIVASASVMAAAVLGLDVVIPHNSPLALRLLVLTFAGAAIYICLIHVLGLPAYLQARGIAIEQSQRVIARLKAASSKLPIALPSGSHTSRAAVCVVARPLGESTQDLSAGGVPSFTVVVPTRNRAELLKQAVSSVLEQTLADFELLIVDDNSSDCTQTVVRAFNDPRVRLLQNDRAPGGAGARNVGILHSRGEWVAFLDDDDVWLPRKLEMQHSRAQEVTPDVALIYAGVHRCNPDLTRILSTSRPGREGRILDDLLYRNYIGTYSQSSFARRRYGR